MYLIEKTSNNSFDITTDGTANVVFKLEKLTPSTYVYNTIEPTAVANDGGEATYSSPKTTLKGDTAIYNYTIIMPSDGVYKLTVDNTTDRIHLFVSMATLYSTLKEHIENVICCNPAEQCKCNEDCRDYYNYNVLAILSQTYFTLDLDIAFDYGVVDGSADHNILETGYKYQCTTADSGSPEWQYGTIDLLLTPTKAIIGDTDSVVLNSIYTCFHTGIPDVYDSAEFTALTPSLILDLKYIADAISRVEDYTNSVCETTNDICAC